MRSIFVTLPNHNHLQRQLIHENAYPDRDHGAFRDLEAELNRAQAVAALEVPSDVVTMHSKARILDLQSGEEMIFTLVFPEEADIEHGKLSVLAPDGTAILGCRAGDIYRWKVPEGERHFKILDVVYQPESHGNMPLESP